MTGPGVMTVFAGGRMSWMPWVCQEKWINRLQLVRLVYSKSNFLVLDEPADHLDIPAREVVENAVYTFRGTLLVVSHDRYFLDKVTDRIVEVKDRQLISHDCSFSEYWLQSFGFRRKAGSHRGAVKQQQVKDTRQDNRRLAELEQQIPDTGAQKLQQEREITRVFEKGDHQEGRKLSVRLEKLIRRIGNLYGEWENLGSR